MSYPYYVSQESYLPADVDPKTDLPLNIGIHDVEESGASKGNDGLFEKGILQAYETDQRTRGTLKEVKVIANGHQHGSFSGFIRDLNVY